MGESGEVLMDNDQLIDQTIKRQKPDSPPTPNKVDVLDCHGQPMTTTKNNLNEIGYFHMDDWIKIKLHERKEHGSK